MSACPKCKSSQCIKDGMIRGNQRYQCKNGGYRHTENVTLFCHALNA